MRCAEDSGVARAPHEDLLPVATEVEAAASEAFAEERVDDVVRAGVAEDEAEDLFAEAEEQAEMIPPP